MKNTIIAAREVTKTFSTGGTQSTVLDNITVDIYAGDFTVIMGASGAGKSTLLYALSGMDSISGGKVLYKEREISAFGEKQMAALRATAFGFVFQQTHLVSNLTLFENVAVAGYLDRSRDAKEVKQRAEKLLSQMHVSDAKNRLPNQTSGGEAQRAAIARAMIHTPGLLFADEPTGALNKRNSMEVLDLLTDLNQQGQSILMVTHDLRAALRGTRVLYLEDGRIIGEKELTPYTGEGTKTREAELNDWLASMDW